MAYRGSRFVFLVPLKARASSRDWARVVERLHETLGSFLNQSEGGFRAVVACQDDPLGATRDPRIEWLKIHSVPPPAGDHAKGLADKYRKLMQMGVHLRESGADDAYLMMADGDDLIHADVVRHTLTHDNRRGHLGPIGYRYDFITRRLALLDPPVRPLVLLCGSTCAAYYTNADLPADRRDRESYFGRMTRHAEVVEHARAMGRELEHFPFPSVVYRVNHEDSQQFIKRGIKRQRGDALDAEGASRVLARDFGWHGPSAAPNAPAMNPADEARAARKRDRLARREGRQVSD